MYIGILLIVLAAFAFASAGLYYVAAILVLCGKLLGALIIGIVGGCRLFAKGAILVTIWLWLVVCALAGLVVGFWRLAAEEGDAATGRAHRAGMVTVEWLKRMYVKCEKRARDAQ